MIDVEQQTLFDYGSLDTETRAFVQEKAQSIHARLKRTAEDVIAIGQDLIAVKGRIGHGQFLSWVQCEFEMSRWSAQDFMRVAEKFGPKWGNFPHLKVSVLYELASPSTPNEIVEMVESGQIPPTISAIREAKHEVLQDLPQQNLTPRQFFDAIAPGFTEWEDERNECPHPSIEYRPYIPPITHQDPSISTKSSTLMALQSSESNEWYTPAQYVEVARELMGGIDLDPASNAVANEVIQASAYYDIDANGLNKSWHGRIWLNPPYGITEGKSNQEVWTHRLIEQFEDGVVTEAVLLVNANTEAKWFQPLYNYLICFTNHRIRFYNTSGESSQPTQGNALVYFGSQQRRFIELFSRFGRVVREARTNDY